MLLSSRLGKEEKGILVRYPGKPCLRSSHHGGIKNLDETLRVTLVSANFSTEGLTKNSPAEMQIPFTRRWTTYRWSPRTGVAVNFNERNYRFRASKGKEFVQRWSSRCHPIIRSKKYLGRINFPVKSFHLNFMLNSPDSRKFFYDNNKMLVEQVKRMWNNFFIVFDDLSSFKL